jgi:signal transduction histidine kinase
VSVPARPTRLLNGNRFLTSTPMWTIPRQWERPAARVFEAGFSMKKGGRGMVLTIARRLVEGHGGRIDVLVDRRRKGANLRIVLPRKRSRATFYNGR